MKKILTVALMLLMLCSCAEKETTKYIEKLDDVNGMTISLVTGSCFQEEVEERFPDSKVDVYDTQGRIDAVVSGKADVCFCDYPSAVSTVNQREGLAIIDEIFSADENAFAFSKDKTELLNDFNSFMQDIENDGSLEKMRQKWVDENSIDNIELHEFTGENGTIKVAINSNNMPFAFYANNELTGLETDILYRYAYSRGYNLEFVELDLVGMLAAIKVGTCDIAAGSLTITEERKESVNFSIPYYYSSVVGITRKELLKQSTSFIDELKDSSIAVIAGSIYIPMIEESFENADIQTFNSNTDCFAALTSGRVDAVVMAGVTAMSYANEFENVEYAGGVGFENLAIVLRKNADMIEILEKLNAYIEKKKEDGTLSSWKEKWTNPEGKSLDNKTIEGINGTLKVAVDPNSGIPYEFMQDGEIVGYEVEIINGFAATYGYGVEYYMLDFSGSIASTSSGKTDISIASIAYTDERAESMYFSEYIDSNEVGCLVLKKENNTTFNFIENFKANFEKAFIRENRWMMFLKGVGSTVLISIASIFFGTILGFALYLLFRTNNKIVNIFIRFYSWLIRGMPTVVLLMVLFYVIFAKVNINGTIISIIGFTIIFSITIFGMLKQCFDAIDIGQYEASYALGYSKIDTFFKIILPQTMPMFLPSFKAEVVSLIKATSIVGYIAVQDLTKMSDLVRSRTYEAFFPLIGATILYFIIAAVFNITIKYLMRVTDPKHRSKDAILKGVNTNDRT